MIPIHEKIAYQPTGKQMAFHLSTANEVLFGGAAGGGKSKALVMDALARLLAHPGTHAYLFRRTYTELDQYINEGYGRLLSMAGVEAEPLLLDADEPILPEWMHPAIADFATFLLLRNGNPQRQSRGLQYRAAYEEAVARFFRDGGLKGKQSNFHGVYP